MKRPKTKLVLRGERLRVLAEHQLRTAAGGIDGSARDVTSCDTCSNTNPWVCAMVASGAL